ncbi:MAG: DUF512 domain-containing protein [Ruminococcaceae bacterium]|nr:DUF512 domain-containing protein [Oscillospiraceae bacterium]
MVKICGVESGSLAEKAGLLPEDYLIKINGEDINDVLDYRFHIANKKIILTVHRGEELFDIKIRKPEYEDIGLEFESFLMDEKRSCRNKCIFCFIDQNPHGLRDTIYFKDDDSRMSFLTGSYITLTNLSDSDIDRICKMKISPINISVHTTNPGLRCKMMNNRFAGDSLSAIKRFCDAGITLNTQIVLCKGVNDKEQLTRTMNDLEAFYPQIQSVSVVPCGLTKFREGLFPLEPFTAEECAEVIAQVKEFSEKCREKHGCGIFYLGDEFFIKSGIKLPDAEYYDGYPQIENGVGLITSMKDEFYDELDFIDTYDTEKERDLSIATGEAAYGFISEIAKALCNKLPRTKISVYKIKNNFFGENITVAGLITGTDLKEQLKGRELGQRLYLPSVMLRYENDLFLDNVSIDELSDFLGVEISLVNNSGYELIEKLMND